METEDKQPSSPIADPEKEGVVAPGAVEPAPGIRRNHFQATDDPKIIQFSARARKADADRIKEALEVRKGNKETYDIVCLVIDCLNHIEADILQTFKTKKKR
jgi:hypothetical protein